MKILNKIARRILLKSIDLDFRTLRNEAIDAILFGDVLEIRTHWKIGEKEMNIKVIINKG